MRALSVLPRTLPSVGDIWDEMDRFFASSPVNRSTCFVPAVDVVEKDEGYELVADLPGLTKKDINVNAKDGILTISGEKKSELKQKEKGYSYYERSCGSFSRSFKLPDTVNSEDISAKYTDGVLTVSLKKKEETKPKQIEIK